MATCKFCEASDLAWKRTARGPRLYDTAGEMHLCKLAASVQNAVQVQAEIPSDLLDRIAALEHQTANTDQLASIEKRLNILEAMRPIQITIDKPTGPVTKTFTRQHPKAQLVLDLAALGENVMMVGPAGSGKTSIGAFVAEALGLEFHAQSMNPQTSKGDLMGFFIPGSGEYKASPLRTAYENGHAFLFDEIDAGNGAVTTCLNAILANGHAGFPDKMIAKHSDFCAMGAGNTYGRGPDAIYIGRAPLDGALLDRFVFVEIGYDWDLVADLSGNESWTRYVERISEAVIETRERVIVGPRAALSGARLLAAGMDRAEVEQLTIWRKMASASADKIRSAAGL